MAALSTVVLAILLLAGEALWFAYHESFMRAIRARDSAIAKGGYGTALMGGLGMILAIVSSLVISEKLASSLNLRNWLADHLSVSSSGWVSTLGDILFAGVIAGVGILLVKITGLEKVFRKHEVEHRNQHEG
jgi:hypothetical protein